MTGPVRGRIYRREISMDESVKIEKWKELKFGMFVHYGLYSIPGGVWKGTPVTRGYSEQILSHGPVDRTEYEALAGEMTAEHFDAREIAALAKEAGMTYIVLGTKHHDGFCLFRTATTRYSTYDTAAGRDLVGELAEACREAGLGLGLYFSWIDWHTSAAVPMSDHNSDPIPEAHMQLNREQVTELLSNYGSVREIWFDMGAPTEKQSREMAELVRSLQPETMINGRIWNGQEDFLVMGDNEIPDFKMTCPWQTPASIYHETWGYRSWQAREDLSGKIREQIRNLAYISARGGNFLLNIGPMGDGTLVPFEKDVLKGVGRWLKLHRPAVFGVEPNPWSIFEWGECSLKGRSLYVMQFRMPADGAILLAGLETLPDKAFYMEDGSAVTCRMTAEGVVLIGLKEAAGEPLPVIELSFAADPVIRKTPHEPDSEGLLPPGEPIRHFEGKEYYSYRSYISRMEWLLDHPGGETADLYWELPEPAGENLSLALTGEEEETGFLIPKGERSGPAGRITFRDDKGVRKTALVLLKGSGIPGGLRLGIRRDA